MSVNLIQFMELLEMFAHQIFDLITINENSSVSVAEQGILHQTARSSFCLIKQTFKKLCDHSLTNPSESWDIK